MSKVTKIEYRRIGASERFEDYIKELKLSQIVMAMVNGLRKRWVKVDMSTFGNAHEGICYGCAATNTLCELAGYSFTPETIEEVGRLKTIHCSDVEFLIDFEFAVDKLRQGMYGFFIDIQQCLSLFSIPDEHLALKIRDLPTLRTSFSDYELDAYELAEAGY